MVRLIYVVIVLLILVNPVFADDDPQTPWTIEERCVSAPIQPQNGWVFEGTIIAQGWAGIHGISAAQNTPYVLAFRGGWIEDFGSGTLSPDGHWYVVPQADFQPDSNDIYGGSIHVHYLMVYDLLNKQNVIQIEWDDTYPISIGSGLTQAKHSRTPVWFDANTIVYQRGDDYYFIHLPEVEIELWSDPLEWTSFDPVQAFITYPSPDWTRIFEIDGATLLNTETDEIITDVYDDFGFPTIVWHPDSTEFLASLSASIILFDKDGEFIDTVASNDDQRVTLLRENAYSPDGNAFWLILNPGLSSDFRTLAIVDRAEKIIVDTCIDARSLSAQFSPDSRYLALLDQGELQELRIFDTEEWQIIHTGIYHSGRILGWRMDD